MRLLNTTTLELKEYFDNRIPKYAISSPHWEDGEVSLQDFIAIRRLEEPKYKPYAGFLELSMTTPKDSPGPKKIVKCCEIAASDSLEWVWIDTYCIDKNSSAELSEAIKSMYRWYAKAEICYAYLADVTTAVGADLSRLFSTGQECGFDYDEYIALYEANGDIPVEFRQSKWFTRGWTLQELLASNHLLFLTKNWTPFGTKFNVANKINAVTGIPMNTLGWGPVSPLRPFSVAQKMSWAADWVTSRIEDIAYCLLGILGVNMPLLYGEGRRAFRRLQEELLKGPADETIFMWDRSGDDNGALLVPSPRVFKKCGEVAISKESLLAGRSSSVIVSQLLQMDVHTLAIPRKVIDEITYNIYPSHARPDFCFFLVPLNCRLDEDPTASLALLLYEDSDANELY
jgi:hypothetical protein